MKYSCYDRKGNKKAENVNNLKDAVKKSLKLDCEIHDENGYVVFSRWNGWNGNYPNIKIIYFHVADMQMIDKAKRFLNLTHMRDEWILFECDQFSKWLYLAKSEHLHHDRWNAVYDWVNGGRFADINIPEDIVKCLVEYWETNGLHIKLGI